MSAQRLARVLVVEDDDLSLDIATRWLRRGAAGSTCETHCMRRVGISG